jgi:hypothetical protein
LTNENISELKKMLKKNYISNINKELNTDDLPYEINKTLKTEIFNAFDKMYVN